MKYVTLFSLLIFCLSCKAQRAIDSTQLNEELYQVLKTFINQKYNHENKFYFNENIDQIEYSSTFKKNYMRLLKLYRNADSICNSTLDTLTLKTSCEKANSYKKYDNLFTKNDLDFFENTYKNNLRNKFVIDLKKLLHINPIISNHSEKFYKEESESLNFTEIPSLKIHGIYFTKNKNHVLIAHTMFPLSLRNGLEYGILKKERGIGWRYIGTIKHNTN